MARDEDDFRIRPGKVRDRGDVRTSARRLGGMRRRPASFLGEVHQAIRRAGGNPDRPGWAGKGSGRFNARGRGAATALALKDRSAWSRDGNGVRTRARRVAVKARVVKLNPQRGATRGRQFVSATAVDAHLRYLERDGVTRDGEKGQVYSGERDVEDGRAFLDRGRDDRHQFRFIVSAEDGAELADPRQTTRDLMKQMEADLGTKLDWIAVDHHNTGHPHTHILVRGIKARMGELEQQQAEIEALLAEAPADLPDVHPNIAEHYRAKVIRLAETLAEPESNGEAREDIRSLIGEVVITPGEKRGESHARHPTGRTGGDSRPCSRPSELSQTRSYNKRACRCGI
jgi:hypothetical protein